MSNSSRSGRGQSHVTNFYILHLKNFPTASHQCIGVVNKLRRRSACGLHLRRSSALWLNAQVYYTSVDCKCNPLTPLLRFALGLSCVQVVPTLLCSSWHDSDSHRVARSDCGSRATCTYSTPIAPTGRCIN